jgi:hypothetical protein
MVRAAWISLLLIVTVTVAPAQTPKPQTPHDIAEASRLLAEKREACRQEAKAQKQLSVYQKRKYRLACLKR